MNKKLIIVSVLSLLLLSACGGQAIDGVSNETEDELKQEEVKKEEEKPIDVKIDVNKELNFEQFDVELKTVKVYEKDDTVFADISLDWTNKAQDYGEEMTLFVATVFEVKQGDKDLEEINDAWNPENKNTSDVFFPNTLGGEWSVDLTYELADETTPIDIIFTPTTETEGSETITVDIPK